MCVFAEVLGRLRFLYKNTYDTSHCFMLTESLWQPFLFVDQLLPETLREQMPGFQVTEIWNRCITQRAFKHFLCCMKSRGP